MESAQLNFSISTTYTIAIHHLGGVTRTRMCGYCYYHYYAVVWLPPCYYSITRQQDEHVTTMSHLITSNYTVTVAIITMHKLSCCSHPSSNRVSNVNIVINHTI